MAKKKEDELGCFAIHTEDKFECPKCGDVGSEQIEVTIPPYSGHYCLKCWARWINKNLPQLRKI